MIQQTSAKYVMHIIYSLPTLLLPKSDKHLISPCNITPESNIKVMSCENEGNDHLLKETLDC